MVNGFRHIGAEDEFVWGRWDLNPAACLLAE
jgi:hypothetical protein